MKKIFKHITLCVLLSMVAFTGYSQFTFGPQVGVNLSNINDRTKLAPGFDAGIFFRLGTNFYFQPEVHYSFRSSTFRGAFEEIENNFKFKTHNIDIPLLFGYKFIAFENFNFRVFIGPRLGILIDNSLKEPRNSNPLSKIQIGGQAGIGIDFWRFSLDARYDFSGTKYNSTVNENSSTWWTQNMINLVLGFKIIKN